MSTLAAPTATTSIADAPAADVARRRAALIAGVSYVALFVLAIFANFVVIEGLVVADDPVATLEALAADRGVFRLGIVAFLAIAVLDVVVAWALHVLLRPVAPDRSLLAAWLRVVYGGLLAVALASLLRADALVGQVAALGDRAATEVGVALTTFDLMWQVGLVFFGLHLLVVTSLLVRGARAPRGLRVLLAVAGTAYVIDALLQVGMIDYASIAGVLLPLVAIPSVLGEGWFAGWLLMRAGRRRHVRRVLES
jgi:hypothetical protein